MNYRKEGFTQRRPQEPGVYLVSAHNVRPKAAPPRLQHGWDVAEIMYWAGSYDNAYKTSDRNAFWQVTTLGGGVTYAWQPGMWTKGPITPDRVTPNAELTGPRRPEQERAT